MAKQAQLKREDIPSGWSVESADFVNRVNKIIKKFIIN